VKMSDSGAFPQDGVPVSLPRGRILYRTADERPFVLLLHEPTRALYLAPDGWTRDSLVAGPFAEHDALRAWRLANMRIPEGCERGPWQWGIALFERRSLPFPPHEASAFDPSWLPPSTTRYADADTDGVVNEVCCGAPRDEPHVRWTDATRGELAREWNAHPAGSRVEREGPGAFVVVDAAPCTAPA